MPAHGADPLGPATVKDGYRPHWAAAGLMTVSLLAGATGAQAAHHVQQQTDTTRLRQRLEQVFNRRRQRDRVLDRLDYLELSGKLEQQATDGTTLLQNLERVSFQDLADKVKRKDLLEDLFTHLADPEQMSQGERGTCAVTGIAHVLADRHPAEYVRLVGGLASPGGRVSASNGEDLVRVEGSIRDDSGRDLPSRLLQSALMEYGNGSETYSNHEDWHTGPQDQIAVLHEANPWVEDSGHMDGGHPGLYPNEITRVLRAVLPGEAETHFVNPERAARHLDHIGEAHRRGETVVVGLKWRDSAHLLVVKDVQNDHLVLWNPWGEDDLDEQPGPERTLLNDSGRVRIDSEVVRDRLLVYEVGGITGH